jgi:hypothetical protein
MLTYRYYGEHPEEPKNYNKSIMKFVSRKMKYHRSSLDQEIGYIAQIWKEAMIQEEA